MHIIGYIITAGIFFLLGYMFTRTKQDNLPRHSEPPPPPVKRPSTKKGHMTPGYYAYKPGNFARVNKCVSCGVVGLSEDMHEINPCIICGGKVKSNGAAKWVKVDGQFQWVSAQLTYE